MTQQVTDFAGHRKAKTAVVSKGYLVFVITVPLLISTIKVAEGELLAPLYAPVAQELGLNDVQFGRIRSAANIAMIIGSILFGLLADRWRRRDVVGLSVLCWSAITRVTGLVQSFLQLFMARASMTFFEAGFSAAAYPMIADLVPRRSRGIVMGLMGATFALGTVVSNDPPILVADEPTGNLDSKTADSVFDLFERLTEQGKTLLMVTHDVGLAGRASRTIVLSDGKIVEDRRA